MTKKDTQTKVWITGGSGMVGRNLIEKNNNKSFKLLCPNRAELDLTKIKRIKEWLAINKPDIVIHSAAKVGGIHANIAEPTSFLLTNIKINNNVIEASYESKIKYFLNLGSSCMYPRNAENPLKENSILTSDLEPTNEGYALAKICAAKLCEYLSVEDKSIFYKTLIPCNLYGRYDSFSTQRSHLIPSIIVKLHTAITNNINEVEIWGDGSVRREFMYSSDLAEAIWFCLHNIKKLPDCLNVGCGRDYSILEFYQIAAKILNYTGAFKFDKDKPQGMKRKIVNSKNINLLGWEAKTTLEEGIKKTYDFYIKNHLDKNSIFA